MSSRRLSVSNRSSRGKGSERDSSAASIVPYLANRCYHIPGNNWRQDYVQYFANNHPVFGMCCHHRLHPVKFRQRFFILIGSIFFGLAVTNCVVLYFVHHSNDGFDAKVFSVGNITFGEDENASIQELSVTNGQIFLWTVGSALHSMFDLTVWHLAACACCQTGGCLQACGCCKMLGSYIVIFITVVTVAIATFIVIVRASIIGSDTDTSLQQSPNTTTTDEQDTIHLGDINGIEDFRFLISFAIEVGLALFVWYYVAGTVLFSGILGCGRVPVIGGRPLEMRQAIEKAKRKNSRQSSSDIESFRDET